MSVGTIEMLRAQAENSDVNSKHAAAIVCGKRLMSSGYNHYVNTSDYLSETISRKCNQRRTCKTFLTKLLRPNKQCEKCGQLEYFKV